MELTNLIKPNREVLAEIGRTEHRTVTSLAKALGRDKSNLSKTLTALAEAGLIEKPSGAPQSGPPAKLTDAGREALEALERTAPLPPLQLAGAAAAGGGTTLRHRQIFPDPDQPRKFFDEEDLDELGGSIVLDGLLQDLTVRPAPLRTDDDLPMFVLVAGERRWRAIGRRIEAGDLDPDWPVGVKIRELDEASVRRIALIENLQRKDLKPLEEARAIEAYRALTDASNADVAAMLNRTPRFVQRRLQLLQLSAEKMKQLEAGKITLEEAWRWLDNRPTAPELPARQWLIALEILDKALRAPLEGEKPGANARVEVGPAAEEDQDFKAITGWPTYLAAGPYEITTEPGRRRTGRYNVYMPTYGGTEKLALRFGEAVCKGGEPLDEALAAVRNEVAGGDCPPLKAGEYLTPWLNGPFEVTQAVLDEIKAEEAATEARRQQWAREQAAQAKAETAALEKAETLRSVAALTADRDEIAPLLQDTASAAGWTLPVAVDASGSIVDAAGLEIVRTGYEAGHTPAKLVIKNSLLAVAINAAAGLATPAAAAAPTCVSRAAFVQLIADAIRDACSPEEDDGLVEVARPDENERLAMAERGLDAYLAAEGVEYGDTDYDWTETGAEDLALGILEDGLGQEGVTMAGEIRGELAEEQRQHEADQAAAAGEELPA